MTVGAESAAIPLFTYSMRMLEIARLMTSCWICSVPSKMSWLTFTGFVSAAQCCCVPLTRAFANRMSAECCPVR